MYHLNSYTNTKQFINSLVTSDYKDLKHIGNSNKKELVSIFLSECEDDYYSDVMFDPQVKELISKLVLDGIDYAFALQEVITRICFQQCYQLFEDFWVDKEADLRDFLKYEAKYHVDNGELRI